MKKYRVRVVSDVWVEFENDQASDKSAAHVAINNWTFPGRAIEKLDRKLGRVRAFQEGPAEIQGIIMPWEKDGR